MHRLRCLCHHMPRFGGGDRVMGEHIASLVVRTRPEHADRVAAQLSGMVGVEVSWRSDDRSKAVVVLETESAGALAERIESIGAVSGVVTADLAYSCEEA